MLEKVNAEVFLAVAELGSYRKAADSLGYTQAGISYIINAMEEEMGLKLFVREHGGVSLSANGEEILPWVRQCANSHRLLDQRVGELTKLASGTVRVMSFSSVLVYWIPGIIERFHRDHPGVKIELISCERFEEMEEAVFRREADCGFFLHPVTKPIDLIPLSDEPMMVAMSPDHPLARRKKFPVSELGKHPYIGPPIEHDPGVRALFEEHGIEPLVGFTTQNDYAALALASRNLGYCIYPRLMLQECHFPLKYMELDKPLVWHFGIGTRSLETCSAAARAFIQYSEDWVKNH